MSDTINYQGVKPSFEMGRVLNRTFSGVFKNIKYILAAIVIVFLVITALSAPMYFAGISNPTAPSISVLYLVTSILSLIIFFFSMMFISVFTDHLAFASFIHKTPGFKAVFMRSLKLALPVLFVVILYVIATYAGLFLLIIPGVIISVGWIVIGPAYLHEETSLFGSFGRSWQLTSGYKWWVWLATIVMGLIVTFFISISAILISTLSLGQVSSEGMNVGFSTTSFLGSVLFSLLIYLTLALYASFTAALYTELREIKEGPLAEEMSAVFD